MPVRALANLPRGSRPPARAGTEGKLGGQAQVPEVTGVWKDLTESVNSMASNLTAQVRNLAEVTIAVANGDLSKKITVDVRGEILQLKEAINTMVDQLRAFGLLGANRRRPGQARATQRIAELALTSNAAAASWQEAPASTARTTRSRNSCE